MPNTPVPSRRSRLRGGATLGALGAVGALATATGATSAQAATPRKPVLVGANPGIQLFDATGACTGYASVWHVDWSTHGSGEAVVVWTPEGVTVTSPTLPLARWLWEDYTSNFPELEDLPRPEPTYRRQHVRIDLDLATGLVARAGSTLVCLSDVLDHRWVDIPEFTLGDRSESLNFVLGPCGQGSISIAGRPLPGAITRAGTPERPSSSAFLSQAEVWRA